MPTLNETIQSDRKPIGQLHPAFVERSIWVDDSFQRRSVWVQKNRVRLIETVLKGLPMPEIYMWASKPDLATGLTKYSVVDGQQRLTSIRDFIAGVFELTATYLDDPKSVYGDKKFLDLDDTHKAMIWEYHITTRTIPSHVSRQQIVEMFLRLNETDKSLNPQELRNAEFNGEFIKAAEEIAKSEFWEKNKIFTSAQIRRMGDLQFASSLLIFLRSGVEAEVTQQAINKVYDDYNDNYFEKKSDIAEVAACLDRIDQIFDASENVRKFFRSAVHLYPLFICIFTARQNSMNFSPISWSASLDKFVDEYFSDSPAEGVAQYRQAATEGTQKRANRAERVKQLSLWLD